MAALCSAGPHAATGRATRTPGRVQRAGRVAAAPRPSSFGATAHQQQHQQLVQALPHAAPSDCVSAPLAGSSKYQRILAFVDSHATPSMMVGDSWPGSCSSSGVEEEQLAAAAVGDVATSSWHHSYDEEADEGEDLLHEPHLLACSARTAAAATAAAAAAPMLAAPAWSYGSAADPKPFFFSWDEEAEGSFGLATAAAACSSPSASAAAAAAAAGAAEGARLAAVAQDRAARRAAMHEARHAARTIRRLRRAQLHAQLGDLERMPAYCVQQQQAAAAAQQRPRSPASARYQQLLALVVGEGGSASQYRKPTRWNLTFDEDVHGPEAPETVLGSC